MPKIQLRISDEAVLKATGMTWKEWGRVLDKEGAKAMSHGEIAKLLQREYTGGWPAGRGAKSAGWWCQMVTVGYEQMRGRRAVGETKSAGYEVGVTRTFPLTARQAWDLLLSEEGRSLWLGSIKKVPTKIGQSYETDDGTIGEVRSYAAGKMLRLTWKPAARGQPTTLQIRVAPKGKKSSIHIHQEKLRSRAERERMRRHWTGVMDGLEQMLWQGVLAQLGQLL